MDAERVADAIGKQEWLNPAEEALQAGVEDCLKSDKLCFIEWADKAPGLLPDDCFHVYIKVLDENTREINVQ